jgi:hypothetical protein
MVNKIEQLAHRAIARRLTFSFAISFTNRDERSVEIVAMLA